jgi:ribose-phosphate pyrophosphokinase
VKLLVLAMPGNRRTAAALCEHSGAELGSLEVRSFPDGESYVRIVDDVAGRKLALVCTLDRPDAKIPSLLFAAAAAKDLGAKALYLVAPYLCYMRQDRRFRDGEAVTSAYFARLIGSWFDGLVTVDPHLHRHASLGEIYSIPAIALQSAPLLSEWIERNVEAPLLVGPDSESEQWVESVARRAGAPYVVLRKTRRGDREVAISIPDVSPWRDRTPVLIDDIVSTARTMIEAVRRLRAEGLAAPVCVGIHAVFSGSAEADLRAAGATRVVTCDTIAHPSNVVSTAALIASGLVRLVGRD